MQRRFLIAVSCAVVAAVAGGVALSVGARRSAIRHPRSGLAVAVPGADGDVTLLHNGWRIQPEGRHIACGDMPLGGAVSPDGKQVLISNCGFGAHAIHLLDVVSEREIARLPVARAWSGAAWARDGSRFWVSGGPGNTLNDVYCYERNGDEWRRGQGLKLKGPAVGSVCVSGLSLSSDGRALFALNLGDHRLYAVDAANGESLGRADLGLHPVACVPSADRRALYVALWGASEVARVAVDDPARPTVTARWKVGSHPNSLALDDAGRLFVVCGNDDVVDVLDTARGERAERIRTGPRTRSPLGSTPNSIAIGPGRLYVANADNNSVCVVE
ncbi:MAG: YncE family protein, partial [Armatimonadetes bacterium]|nr:YncE family protein [Armatimonadota bacterium]